MSTLKIEERVAVAAPPERVWRFMLSPKDIVTCLPGAGLDKVEDDRNFHGNIKVKVGPVTVAYKGKATLTDVDDENHNVTMVGEGKEKGGAGKVKMTMQSHIEAVDGGSEVVVVADVELAGKVVRFGRGMIQGVSKEVFKQFGNRLRAKLEVEAPEPAEAEAPAAPEPEPEQAPTPEPEPVAEAAATPEPEAEASTDTGEASETAEGSEPEPEAAEEAPFRAKPVEHVPEHVAEPVPERSAVSEPRPAKPEPQRAIAPVEEDQEAVNAVGLVFKVMWQGFLNFFRRLFGRPEKF